MTFPNPSSSKPDPGAPYVVSCRQCLVIVYGAETRPDDGQVLLTQYADINCKEATCPHKTPEIVKQKKGRPATVGELEALAARVEKLEPKK